MKMMRTKKEIVDRILPSNPQEILDDLVAFMLAEGTSIFFVYHYQVWGRTACKAIYCVISGGLCWLSGGLSCLHASGQEGNPSNGHSV